MSKTKDTQNLNSFKMPAITIDGKRLWYCEMRAGDKNNKKAFLDLQDTILDLWNIYSLPTASERKKNEAKEGLLYYEEYLKLNISGQAENNLIKPTDEQRRQIYNERHARQRDMLNVYDKKMVALDDAQHRTLSVYDGETIYEAKEAIQGMKLAPKPTEDTTQATPSEKVSAT
jgi:hypothetical protein